MEDHSQDQGHIFIIEGTSDLMLYISDYNDEKYYFVNKSYATIIHLTIVAE